MWMIFKFLLVFFLNIQEDSMPGFVGMRWGLGGMAEITSSPSFNESLEEERSPCPKPGDVFVSLQVCP